MVQLKWQIYMGLPVMPQFVWAYCDTKPAALGGSESCGVPGCSFSQDGCRLALCMVSLKLFSC